MRIKEILMITKEKNINLNSMILLVIKKRHIKNLLMKMTIMINLVKKKLECHNLIQLISKIRKKSLKKKNFMIIFKNKLDYNNQIQVEKDLISMIFNLL